MSAKAISSAVEGGGGFVRDASQKRQHALDSADVVREAIARFPKSDLELGENKDVAFQAFTDCQQCVSQSVVRLALPSRLAAGYAPFLLVTGALADRGCVVS